MSTAEIGPTIGMSVVSRPAGTSDLELMSRDGSQRAGLIERKGLVRDLDRAVAKSVTVVASPAGSGKTSLLRAWTDHSSAVRRIAFVTVEREQQTVQVFWDAVLRAISEAMPPGSSNPTPSPGSNIDENPFESVLSTIAGLSEALVLVIDDLHELTSAIALRQLEQLLTQLPGRIRVVLSSRRDPPIRLHQFRLDDDLAEIRWGDLRFTEDETRQMLSGSGIALSHTGIAALHQRTEGWAAGLRLATISLGSHPDPEHFVTEFSGTDRAVGEYLMVEMLERQPIDVQLMLLRTSVVDRITGELADLLAARSGSERILLSLEDANAFVVSLDAARTSFRYHQLLTDFLRLELRRTMADEIPELRRRAAGWFRDRGDVVEAVQHTVAAGRWPDAASLVADHSFTWVLGGEADTIRTVLRSFPEGAAANHPDLALAQAALEVNQGRTEEAAVQLDLAETHMRNAPLVRRRRLAVAISALRLANARRSGRFSEVIDQVRTLDASIADRSDESTASDSELRGVALLNLGIVETWTGRLLEAEQHLSEGASLARRIGRPYLEVACRAHQGFPSPLIPVATARERGRQAVALAERYGLADRPILATALGAVGGMSIWMGDLDEGERWLQRAWQVGSAQVEPATAVLLHLATAMLHAGRGELPSSLDALTAAARAQSLLTGAHALAPRITGWLAATQARVGSLDEARATLTTSSAAPGRTGVIANARAVIHLAEGDVAAAIKSLQEVFEPSTAYEPFTLVEAHVLVGTAWLRQGDRSAAAAHAETALAIAEPDRLIFPFAMADAGALLETLPPHSTSHAALVSDILDLLAGASPSIRDRESASETGRLSASELRVLGYLPTNLTRPEIAAELQVSINTVNTHIRNVYAKLGARDRSAAIRRARQLRLLGSGRQLSRSS